MKSHCCLIIFWHHLKMGFQISMQQSPVHASRLAIRAGTSIYYMLLSHLNPSTFNLVIETGTNWGCTTIILAQALKDSGCRGRVVNIEINPDHHARAMDNLVRAGVMDVVTAKLGDSKLLLKEMAKQKFPIRCALLDASHLFEEVIDEFETIYPVLTAESIVLFDNTYQIAEEHADQRVNGALKYIQYRFGGNVVNFEFVLTCPPKTGPDFVREIWHNLRPKPGRWV
jgi:predicted O-methyltransferase YrrM